MSQLLNNLRQWDRPCCSWVGAAPAQVQKKILTARKTFKYMFLFIFIAFHSCNPTKALRNQLRRDGLELGFDPWPTLS